MKTTIFNSNQLEQGLLLAAEKLRNNEVIAFPTETVYGLGARIFSDQAIQRIYDVKGRPSDNPLIAHVSNMQQVEMIARDLPTHFEQLTTIFWPGPLTLVVPKQPNVPEIATAGLSTIGIRMPNHPLALALIEHVGEPIVAPSANISGRPSPTTAEHVMQDLDGKIEVILDGGSSPIGIESTILDLTTSVPTILRPGVITQAEIEEVLGFPITSSTFANTDERPKAPGMKYRHYAPVAKIEIIENWNPEIIQKIQSFQGSTVVLSDEDVPESIENTIPTWPLNTSMLYSAFRKADELSFSHIFIVLTQKIKDNSGLIDRISKASNT